MIDKQCEHCKTWASYTYQGFCKIECAVAKVRELECQLLKVASMIEFHPSDILPTKLRELLKEGER